MTEEKNTKETETEFLDEALALAREVIAARNRLESARRDHAALLAQREDALSEGIDLLPEIRRIHLEIEGLTPELSGREHQIYWLVNQGISKVTAENNRISGQRYIENRDALRKVLEQFREGYACVQRNVQASANLGPSLTEPHNAKLAQIEDIQGGVHFPRVTYCHLPLPPINAELVNRNQLLAALDNWIAVLR